jgi:Ca2+-binding EF-hand superfamily protein
MVNPGRCLSLTPAHRRAQKVSQDIDVDGSGTVEFHQLREMISDVIHEED